jgi:hypothetical protein
MKMNKYILMAFALSLFSAGSCAQWGNRIKGNGNETTEQREVGSYDRISVSHIFKVELIPGDEGSLRLEGEENLLDYVITDVSGGRLKITVEKGIQLEPSRRSDGIRIRVPVRDLDGLSVSGAADLTGSGEFVFPSFSVESSGASEVKLALQSDAVRVQTSGASDIVLKGRTETLEVQSSGASHLKAYDLESREAEVSVSGASEARISVSGELKARASGAAHIRYRGNPEKLDSKASRAADVSKG